MQPTPCLHRRAGLTAPNGAQGLSAGPENCELSSLVRTAEPFSFMTTEKLATGDTVRKHHVYASSGKTRIQPLLW